MFGFHVSRGHIKVHASGAIIATHLLVFFATDIHCPGQCPLKLTNGFIMYVAPDYPDNEVNCQYECCTLTSRRCSFGCLSRPWHFYTCSSCIFPLLVKPFMCCFILLCASRSSLCAYFLVRHTEANQSLIMTISGAAYRVAKMKTRARLHTAMWQAATVNIRY